MCCLCLLTACPWLLWQSQCTSHQLDFWNLFFGHCVFSIHSQKKDVTWNKDTFLMWVLTYLMMAFMSQSVSQAWTRAQLCAIYTNFECLSAQYYTEWNLAQPKTCLSAKSLLGGLWNQIELQVLDVHDKRASCGIMMPLSATKTDAGWLNVEQVENFFHKKAWMPGKKYKKGGMLARENVIAISDLWV